GDDLPPPPGPPGVVRGGRPGGAPRVGGERRHQTPPAALPPGVTPSPGRCVTSAATCARRMSRSKRRGGAGGTGRRRGGGRAVRLLSPGASGDRAVTTGDGRMEHRPFGRTGLQVSPIGFGCWEIGGGYGAVDRAEFDRAVGRALDLGVNCFD